MAASALRSRDNEWGWPDGPVDGVTTRDEATLVSGRGVGMAAVKAAVDALGGRIVVRSEIAVGATFEFRIPDREAVATLPLPEVAKAGPAPAVPPPHTGALTT